MFSEFSPVLLNLPKLLYVDDEPLAGKYLIHSLAGICQVQTVSSAAEGLAVLAKESLQTSVILTDYRMPDMDGGKFLYEIEQRYPKMFAIILVTAYADKEALLSCMESSQLFGVLEKPLNVEKLRSTVVSALRHVQNIRQQQQRWQVVQELIGFLMHELNTPLASIALSSAALPKLLVNLPQSIQEQIAANATPNIQELAQRIELNARYCMATLESFLHSFNPGILRSGTETALTAAQIVHHVIETYPFIGTQQRWLELEVINDFSIHRLPECVGMVVSSMVTNALRILNDIPQPKLQIRIEVQEFPCIHIIDNGPGIPAVVLEKFNNLYVNALERKKAMLKTEISGRGLVFSRHIMEAIGGRLLLQSGSGTCITLQFSNLPTP